MIPLLIYFIFMHSWLPALLVFAFASLTDLLDGWSARKLNQESEFGKFINPIADKLLVIASLLAIMVIDPYFEVLDFWMILIIVGRDILITFMRYLAIKRGQPLRTSHFGKFKTGFQMVSIIIILMIFLVRKELVVLKLYPSIPFWIMLGVTLLTAMSGIRYLVTNWNLFVREGRDDGDR